MNKYLVLSMVLLGYFAAQGMQQRKSNINTYAEKARHAAYSSAAYASVYEGGNVTKTGREMQKWSSQLDSLKTLLGEKTLYLGVPETEQAATPKWGSRFLNYWLGNYNQIPKQYSLLKGFGNIDGAFDLSHYELYLMPSDTQLYDVCEALVDNITWFYKHIYNKDAQKEIAFIAVRPTPGVTKSPFDGKPMPRIVVGFKSVSDLRTHAGLTQKEEVENLIYFLSETTKGTGCIGTPRYSNRFANSCIFWRHTSPDNRSQLYIDNMSDEAVLFKPNTPATSDRYARWEPSEKVRQAAENANKPKK